MVKKQQAYNVRWANGRAVVSYATEAMAKEAATRLGDGKVSYGPVKGRIRTTLPKLQNRG